MQRVWFLIYDVVVVPLLWVAIRIAAGFKRKIRRGIRGRRHLWTKLQWQINRLPSASNKRVWFHSSSMGEFEQAKPIIAELKRRRPDVAVIVSFFSPSGYDHSRNYKLADVITYLPFDWRESARGFIDCTRPDAAVMVRYDVWPNHMRAAANAGVPMLIANATMKRGSARYLPLVNSFHRTMYNGFKFILTVSEEDAAAFRRFGLTGPVVEAIGDTRYDQVNRRSVESKMRHILPPTLTAGRRVFVVGSSWDSDEEALIPVLTRLAADHPTLLTVLVPHEPTEENLERIERELNGKLSSLRFSDLHDYTAQRVLIIDSVGILMALYQYADVAYVGGSFGQGVHNVLEPAVYGAPVVVGPVHGNSQEAVQLIREGAAFAAHSEHELHEHLDRLLRDEAFRIDAGTKGRRFVECHTGATERFLSYLEKVL